MFLKINAFRECPRLNLLTKFRKNITILKKAPVAQLDRAPDYESVGRGFESLRAHQKEIKLRPVRKSLIGFFV